MSHPRVEEVSDSDGDVASDPEEGDIDDFVDSDIMRRIPQPQPPSRSSAPRAPAASNLRGQTLAHDADRTAYSSFQCIYPVYFDGGRSLSQGRRVPASLAVRNPLAREIANACSRLGLPTLLEPEKTHPKDWANPGRVKVGLRQTPQNASGIRSKHHLYVLVAEHLRRHPTTDKSPGLRVRMGSQVQPPEGKPYPKPAVPRGWKMGEYLPYLSPAMTGGGVSENLFKDMMKEMQSGGDPMSALMAGAAGLDGDEASGGGGGGKKKKDRKGKGRT
ncbi:signal recognition particle protein Sec65 [Metarhizium album ARSEF 1941]|uniref:Signal recognition particle protein Sec65 n=1 Tax=Metarhizium album (strain ARSEF 1941) TaxID=1081103 RepID=A0A0B2X085_METAS|nr:signal recognition particle protein Sec65 [Metarhizium album ARSEF 1941]KHO01942.1 signal recognition particle protein Sec65 [Metarhizium album ARSEF 1941]